MVFKMYGKWTGANESLLRVHWCIWSSLVMLSRGLENFDVSLGANKKHTLDYSIENFRISPRQTPHTRFRFDDKFIWEFVCIVYLDPLLNSQNKRWIKCESDKLANPFLERERQWEITQSQKLSEKKNACPIHFERNFLNWDTYTRYECKYILLLCSTQRFGVRITS